MKIVMKINCNDMENVISSALAYDNYYWRKSSERNRKRKTMKKSQEENCILTLLNIDLTHKYYCDTFSSV